MRRGSGVRARAMSATVRVGCAELLRLMNGRPFIAHASDSLEDTDAGASVCVHSAAAHPAIAGCECARAGG